MCQSSFFNRWEVADAMIELQNVSRNFGDKMAVDRIDLVVPRGELFAFLGPNGAGKTTTIKMLVGLIRPSSGTVRVCGHDVVRATRETNRRIGYVPDEPHLYDKLTGREFLRFIADMYGLGSSLSAERIAREIEGFELESFVDDLTESYSHGMKQRTVFAAALLHDPEVLVVDEPMVGLDPLGVRLVKDQLSSRAASGTTVFISTHTLSMAEEIAGRIGIISQGRLRFVGDISALRNELSMRDGKLESLFLELLSGGNGKADIVVKPTEATAPSKF